MEAKCSKCGRDLMEVGAMEYFSGDGYTAHFEQSGENGMLLVTDEETEVQSVLTCTSCGEHVATNYDDVMGAW